MPDTFVYATNTKAPFCASTLLCFCAFVSFVSIVHVFVKANFILSLPYELFFRVRWSPPVSTNSHDNGVGIHKIHKRHKSHLGQVQGWALCSR
jgi:hypothetical protein